MAGETVIMPEDKTKVQLHILTTNYNSSEPLEFTNAEGKTVSIEDFQNHVMNDLRKGAYSQTQYDYIAHSLKSLSMLVNHERMKQERNQRLRNKWQEMYNKNDDGSLVASPEQDAISVKYPRYLLKLTEEARTKRMIRFYMDTIYSIVNISVSVSFNGQRPLIDKIEVPHSISEVREVSQAQQKQPQNNGPGFLS